MANGDPLALTKAAKQYNGQAATKSGVEYVDPKPETKQDLDRPQYGSKVGAPAPKK